MHSVPVPKNTDFLPFNCFPSPKSSANAMDTSMAESIDSPLTPI
jgi:hypothetical protein